MLDEELIKDEEEAKETLQLLKNMHIIESSRDIDTYLKLLDICGRRITELEKKKEKILAEREKNIKRYKRQNSVLLIILFVLLVMLASICLAKMDLSLVYIIVLSCVNTYLIISNYRFIHKAVSIASIVIVIAYSVLSWYANSQGSKLLGDIASYILPGITISSFIAAQVKEMNLKKSFEL